MRTLIEGISSTLKPHKSGHYFPNSLFLATEQYISIINFINNDFQKLVTKIKVKKMSHKYKTKYKLETEFGEFTAEEIRKEGNGGCDAYIFFSLIFPEDGSYSQTFFSFDGRNEGKALEANDLWKVWAMMSKNLMDRKKDLPEWKYIIAEATFEMIREIITSCI